MVADGYELSLRVFFFFFSSRYRRIQAQLLLVSAYYRAYGKIKTESTGYRGRILQFLLPYGKLLTIESRRSGGMENRCLRTLSRPMFTRRFRYDLRCHLRIVPGLSYRVFSSRRTVVHFTRFSRHAIYVNNLVTRATPALFPACAD